MSEKEQILSLQALKWFASLLILGFVLGGCDAPNVENSETLDPSEPISEDLSDDPEPDFNELPPENNDSPQDAGDPSPDLNGNESPTFITPQGIGVAQLGMTLGELQSSVDSSITFSPQSPFMVGFDAIAVQENDTVLYYILHLAGEPFEENDIIQGLFTDNPTFQTREGIGANSLIQDAEAIYGNATLAYNLANEGREFVRFENHPSTNLSFRTGSAGHSLAGIYPEPTSDYNETTEFQPNAIIQSVLLVCLTEECSAIPESGDR